MAQQEPPIFQSGVMLENTYGGLPDRFFARFDPKPVAAPTLIKLNTALAETLGFNPDDLASTDGIAWLAGNAKAEGSEPLSMAYAGQQFGNWVPQLGDGRAHLLGEVVTENGNRFDIQLKGSGPTPFSRSGDGRAALGPVLREYIVSEAMAALNIPTTRALAVAKTGEQVVRETIQPGGIVTRVARAHIRVGTFQYFVARKDEQGLRTLADYTIDRLYPHAKRAENPYLALLENVIQAQAELVAAWMGVGFIHGVMNTDNVSIAGETIDFGPCAFMDDFFADRVFSSIDQTGRYAYSNQPRITHWNLVQFAQALLPLLGESEEQAVERAQKAVNNFPRIYGEANRKVFNAKLGLGEAAQDDALINDLLALMQEQSADFTLTFRALGESDEAFLEQAGNNDAAKTWLSRWHQSIDGVETARATMKAANPAFIPRNHQIEAAIQAALNDDFAPFEKLNAVLAKPFEDQPQNANFALPPKPDEQVRYTFCGT